MFVNFADALGDRFADLRDECSGFYIVPSVPGLPRLGDCRESLDVPVDRLFFPPLIDRLFPRVLSAAVRVADFVSQ